MVTLSVRQILSWISPSICVRWHTLSKALLLSRLSRREEAIENALLSIAGFKWNWSAWTLLASCIGDGEEVSNPFPVFFWLTFLLVIILASTSAVTSRPPTCTTFPNQDFEWTPQSVRERTPPMWSFIRPWVFPKQSVAHGYARACVVPPPRWF